jgi:putative PEP-CTERM system TPR-repeat lipoprotein
MTSTPRTTRRLWRLLPLLAGLLAACSGEKPETLLASAKQHLQRGETRSAVIQLKNALQQVPESGEARMLLGQALLRDGDAVAAAVELRKALQYRHPLDAVAPVLARAMLLQGQSKQVIEQYAGTRLQDAKASAALKTHLSIAYHQQGRPKEGRAALVEALNDDPQHVPAQLLDARQKAGDGDVAGGLSVIESGLARAADDPEAWLAKAEVLLRKNDSAGAAEAYRQTLALRKEALVAHLALIRLAMHGNRPDEAAQQLSALQAVHPNHPETRFVEAQLTAQRRDFVRAKEMVADLLKVAPDHVRILEFAGALELQAGSPVRAETHLTKAMQQAPDERSIRLLLAQSQLRLRLADKTLTTLAPLLALPAPDPTLLSLAADAHLLRGDVKAGEAALQRALKARPNDVRTKTVLALIKLRAGKPEALAELRTVAASDPSGTADMALINALATRRQFDAALKAIEALEKKAQKQAVAGTLRGQIQLAQKDRATARKSFEAAVQADSTHFPAIAFLAALDLGDGRSDTAMQRFEALLKAKPDDVAALLALAELKGAQPDASEDVVQLFNQAIKAEPQSTAPRVRLVRYHLRRSETPAALAAAQQGAAALPNDPQMLDVLGSAQLAAQDAQQAITTFGKLAALLPASAGPQMRLAEAQIAAKQNDAALQSLKRALAISPKLLPAQQAVIALELAAGRPEESKAVARTILSQRPTTAVGQLLEGDVEAAQQNWDGAIAAYQAGLVKAAGSVTLATRMHRSLVQSGKVAEARAYADKWMAGHPKDVAFLAHLGGIAVASSDFAAAEARYRQVTAVEPTNAIALNNIAWAMVKQGKRGGIEYAQKALVQAPDHPAFLDTLAMAFEQDGQIAKALDAQKRAVAKQPANPSLKLHLARLHVRNGDKGRARELLDELTQLGAGFKEQAAVAELGKSL